MARSGFKYKRRERTAEDMRRKASEGSRDWDRLWTVDVKVFKPKEGENIVRILPPTWGLQPWTDEELDKKSDDELKKLQDEEDRFGNGWDLPVYVHYGIGPDNVSYLCREKMLGERCPICEAKTATRDQDEANALMPTKRSLVWVIDRDQEKEGPQLWSMPFSKIRNEIYARSSDKRTGKALIVDDVDEGYDIIFTRSGKDDRTNYTGVEVDRDSSPLHDNEKTQDKWLAYAEEHSLQSILNFYEPEHIEKVLFGRASSRNSDDDDGDDGGAEEGRSSRSRRRSSNRDRRSRDEDERDYMSEDSGADTDDDPEDGERTSRRQRTSKDEDGEEDSGGGRTRRRRSAREEDPDPEEPDADEGDVSQEADADGDGDDTPTDQARSRLRSMRSRRPRSEG